MREWHFDWGRGIAAFVFTILLINLATILGLDSRIFFNGILPVLTFAASYRFFKRKSLFCPKAYLFTVLLCICEIFGTVLRINAGAAGSVQLRGYDIILLIVTALLGAYPLSFFLAGILNFRKETEIPENRHLKGSLFILWMCILLAWLPCYLAFYPGVFCYDVYGQIIQYVEHSFSTHHPLAHTLLLELLMNLGYKIGGSYTAGVALYTFVQMAVLSFAVAYAVNSIRKIGIPRKIRIIILVYFMTVPFFPVLGISSTKDIFFAAFFLLSFMWYIRYLSEKTGKLFLAEGFALFVLTLLFRNNFFHSLLLFLMWLAAGAVKDALLLKRADAKRGALIAMAAMSLATGTCIQKGMQLCLDAREGNIAEILSVPCQQLARAYVMNSQELSEEVRTEIYEFIPEDGLTGYRWALADPVKNSLKSSEFREQPVQFFKLWLKFGLRYPREYIEAFLYNTMGLWYIEDTSYISAKGGFLEIGFLEIEEKYLSPPPEKHSFLPGLEPLYRRILVDSEFLKIPFVSLLFSPAFYTWIIAGCFVSLRMRKEKKFCGLPAFLLCYCLTLAGGPCILVRYCLPYILCVPFLLCRSIWQDD